MPLISCPECGRQVSDQAPSCPGCGVPIAARRPAAPIPPNAMPAAAEARVPARPGFRRRHGALPWLLGVLVLIIGGLIVLRAALSGRSLKESAQSWANQTVGADMVIVNQPTEVKEDQWRAIGFSLPRPARVTVEVQGTAGPEFEIMTMTDRQMREWEAAADRGRGEFHYFPDLSASDTKALRRTGGLQEGTYYVVIDNSDVGDTAPPMNFEDDVVRATVKVTVH